MTGLILTFGLASSHAGIEGVPKLPAQAFDIEDYSVPGSETLQASFKLKSTYPSSAILKHYAEGLSGEWEACQSQVPGWETFVSTDGGSKLVHQVIRYWVNRRQKKMLSLIVRHYSRGAQFRCQPEDDVQHGVVVVSRSPDIKKEIVLLRLACGPAASQSGSDQAQIPRPRQCK